MAAAHQIATTNAPKDLRATTSVPGATPWHLTKDANREGEGGKQIACSKSVASALTPHQRSSAERAANFAP